jgi:hypothetical protein
MIARIAPRWTSSYRLGEYLTVRAGKGSDSASGPEKEMSAIRRRFAKVLLALLAWPVSSADHATARRQTGIGKGQVDTD